jgi:hypothetical protein
LRPQSAVVSDQLRLDGDINKISAIQSNDDVLLLPDTGITRIESTQWQDNDITNLLNTPLTFASTAGIGYLRFIGDNGFVIPAGTVGTVRGVIKASFFMDSSVITCFLLAKSAALYIITAETVQAAKTTKNVPIFTSILVKSI